MNDIEIVIGQFPISMSIDSNVEVIRSILDQTEEGNIVVLPEGALSGYDTDPSFLYEIDIPNLENAIEEIKYQACAHGIHLFLGSALWEKGQWFNTTFYIDSQGKPHLYKKINLATNERGHFKQGSELSTIYSYINGQKVGFGIQMCREIRFPEQWQHLARTGTDLFIYTTNAVNSAKPSTVWRSHLISRAAENQRFVICSNNAKPGQLCHSMAIAPDGSVICEAETEDMTILKCKINIAAISNWYLNQGRSDIVKVEVKVG